MATSTSRSRAGVCGAAMSAEAKEAAPKVGVAHGPPPGESAEEWDAMAGKWDSGLLGMLTSWYNKHMRNIVLAKASEVLLPEPPATASDGKVCHILDFGSATGKMTLPLASRATSLMGVDISSAMCRAMKAKAAKNGVANVDVWAGDITAPDDAMADGASEPPQDGKYDLIVSGSVLHNLPDMPASLRRLWALTRPGGLGVHFVWFGEYGASKPPVRPAGRTDLLSYGGSQNPGGSAGIGDAQLRAECEAAGFEVRETGLLPLVGSFFESASWVYVVTVKPKVATDTGAAAAGAGAGTSASGEAS